tara:strand:- start:45 stop:428 length:384 start_codon:yes stop_codon:yes gene_type:complete
MKLELKHLAPYLTYGLKYVQRVKKQTIQPTFYYRGRLITTKNIDRLIKSGIKKPILRPLSDLTKDINNAYCTFGEQDNDTIKSIDINGDTQQYQDLRYSTILYLCKKHYDFQNLIPSGLAIDINTLT